jgi:hypothetical protein
MKISEKEIKMNDNKRTFAVWGRKRGFSKGGKLIMRQFFFLFLVLVFFNGCEFPNLAERSAVIEGMDAIEDKLDVMKVKEILDSQPEIKFSSIPSHSFHGFHYVGYKGVYGSLNFWIEKPKNGKYNLIYEHSIKHMNLPFDLFQETVDSTWPVMERIENDLVNKLGMKDFRDKIEFSFWFAENPDDKDRSVVVYFEEPPKKKGNVK